MNLASRTGPRRRTLLEGDGGREEARAGLLRVEPGVFVPPLPLASNRAEVPTMSAASAWSATVLAGLGLVLGLHHFGYNVSALVGGVLHGVEHFLGLPVLPT